MAQDIRDKIAKLLALADSPSEAEAKAALLKARELMAKHKLRPEEIKKAENVKVIKETIGVSCTGMTDPWMANLTSTIAEHYCCRSFRRSFKGKNTKHIGLVGLEDDFAICKSVVLYAIDCIQATKKRSRRRTRGSRRPISGRCATPTAGASSTASSRRSRIRTRSTRNGDSSWWSPSR